MSQTGAQQRFTILFRKWQRCNSLLCNTTERNLNKLQRIQNTLARVTCQSPRLSSASGLRKSLHWLYQLDNVLFTKTALIRPTYKALKTGQPVYLHDLLHYHQPARTMRSSSQLLSISRRQGSTFNPRLSVLLHQLSGIPNFLYLHDSSTKSSTTIITFKAHLKTELFAAAYDSV